MSEQRGRPGSGLFSSRAGSAAGNLRSMAGSVNDAASERTAGTLDTENTYMQQYKPSFSTYSQYIFSVLAAVISAKEIWRFPYTVMDHESGLFILLYILFTLTIGIPIVYLELIIGTSFRLGAVQSFKVMNARAMGIGISQLVISFSFLMYQPMIMAWSLYYIYLSFKSILPWAQCPPEKDGIPICCVNDSTTYFWFEKTLNVSTGLRDTAPVTQKHIIYCFLLSWMLAYLCLVRGIRLGAFVSYFTVTIPLIILPIIFIRVLFLDGATDGIKNFLTPNFARGFKVSLPLMLLDTTAQILNTCGVTLGILITFKSRSDKLGYPNFESLLIGTSNMFISILSGAILFAIIGHRAKYKKRPKDEMFVSRGASIIFSVFPHVFDYFKYPNFWSILFFSALVLIAVDSMYGQVNAITLSLMDLEVFTVIPYSTISLFITLSAMLSGLPFVMGNGVYLFEEMDSTLAPVICCAALIEVTYVSWIYGIDRLDDELYQKTEYRLNVVWKFLLKWFIPITLSLIFLSWSAVSIVQRPSYMKYVGCEAGGYKTLKGTRTWFNKTRLTSLEILVEWTIFVLCFLPIPFFIGYYWPKKEQDASEYDRFD